jgi:hypothetical protein
LPRVGTCPFSLEALYHAKKVAPRPRTSVHLKAEAASPIVHMMDGNGQPANRGERVTCDQDCQRVLSSMLAPS